MLSGWINCTLSDLAIPAGLQTGPFGSQLQASEYTNSSFGIPVIMPKDIENGKIKVDTIARVPTEKANKLKRHKLKSGDILFPRRGELGRIGVVSDEEEGWPCGTGCLRARLTDKVSTEFIGHFLRLPQVARWLENNAVGQTMLNLNTAIISELPLLLPPFKEQAKIADVLTTWDEAIEKTKRLLEAKEKRNQWLITRIYQSSTNAKEQTFGDFLSESTIPGSHGATAKKLTVKLYGKGVIPKEEKREGSHNTQYYRRCAGQLIYSKLDFLNGAFGIIPEELNGYETTQDLPAFDISPEINPEWLLGYLTRPVYYKHQVGLARGQRKARRVNPKDFLNSTLFVPPRSRQDKFAEILQEARHDLEKTRLLREKLILQKRGLMQKLLTGEWRVNTAKEGNLLDPPHTNLLPQGGEGTKSSFLPPRPLGRRGLG